MYTGVPLAAVLGAGGASTLACRRRSGFDTLATVVAATTLLMAGVSVCKLLPRRHTEAVHADRPLHMAPGRPALRPSGERRVMGAWAEVP
ncbi:hypothetical protein ACGF5O_44845 [Streptomyces sp. NPDC048291]|uniref:hypothetical protein n=1 Tax=unclassified Streptomyces TaxID=2593676 RepID=UPI00341E06B2